MKQNPHQYIFYRNNLTEHCLEFEHFTWKIKKLTSRRGSSSFKLTAVNITQNGFPAINIIFMVTLRNRIAKANAH